MRSSGNISHPFRRRYPNTGCKVTHHRVPSRCDVAQALHRHTNVHTSSSVVWKKKERRKVVQASRLMSNVEDPSIKSDMKFRRHFGDSSQSAPTSDCTAFKMAAEAAAATTDDATTRRCDDGTTGRSKRWSMHLMHKRTHTPVSLIRPRIHGKQAG